MIEHPEGAQLSKADTRRVLLTEMATLESAMNGLAALSGAERHDLQTTLDAESELWASGGGFMDITGGDRSELQRRLSVILRRPEITDRQRGVVMALLGRLRRQE